MRAKKTREVTVLRKLVFFISFFAVGIFIAVWLLSGVSLWIVAGSAALIVPLFLLFQGKARLRWILSWSGLVLGLVYYIAYTAIFLAPALKLAGHSASFTATVISCPDTYSRFGGVDARVSPVSGLPFTVRVLAAHEATDPLTPGDRISIHASLSSGVDQGEYGHGRVLIAMADSVSVVGRGWPGLRGFGAYAAGAIKHAVVRVFPERTAPLAVAIITGDKALFYESEDGTVSDNFQTVGLSHIVAVSGLHLTYLLAIPGLLIRNKRRFACVVIPLVVLFSAFAGFSPSISRAGIMCIVLAVSAFFRRQQDSLTTLSVALLIILLTDPYASASVSLHLSFGATLGIILFASRLFRAFSRPLSKLSPQKRRLLSYPLSVLAVCLSSMAFTAPLSALHFGRVSLVSPLVSLITFVPLSAAFLLTIAAASIALISPAVGLFAAVPASLILRFLLWIARVFSRLSFAALYTDSPIVVCWIVTAYAVLFFLLVGRVPIRRWLIPGCVLVIALCAVLIVPGLIPTQGLTVTAVDVGQGQCLVLRSGTVTAVVDCGSTSCDDAGDRLVSYLRSKGISSVDLLLLTHYHSDHCNGIPMLMRQLPVRSAILPSQDDTVTWDETVRQLAEARGCRMYTVSDSPAEITFGDSSIRVWPPLADEGENERCLAIVFTHGSFDILVTGDMPAYCELQMLESSDLPDIEVLVVGHHGSPGSTCEELLTAVRPEVALISVGENSYGHPADVILERLSRHGAAVFRTDILGTVTVTSDMEVR